MEGVDCLSNNLYLMAKTSRRQDFLGSSIIHISRSSDERLIQFKFQQTAEAEMDNDLLCNFRKCRTRLNTHAWVRLSKTLYVKCLLNFY